MNLQELQKTIGKREILLRGWNSTTNTMHTLNESEVSVARHVHPGELIFGFGDEDELIPMQFTGLRDAKGTEIFEGDILKFREDIDDATNRKGIAAVWYEGGAFRYGSHIAGMFLQHAVVIGNIFENPDLLFPAK